MTSQCGRKCVKSEVLNLQCEWSNCHQIYNDLSDFYSHLLNHFQSSEDLESSQETGKQFLIINNFLFLLIYVKGDSEGTFSIFESSCHLLLLVYPLKSRGNPIKCLAQGHNK